MEFVRRTEVVEFKDGSFQKLLDQLIRSNLSIPLSRIL